jgi:hypothetical protein
METYVPCLIYGFPESDDRIILDLEFLHDQCPGIMIYTNAVTSHAIGTILYGVQCSINLRGGKVSRISSHHKKLIQTLHKKGNFSTEIGYYVAIQGPWPATYKINYCPRDRGYESDYENSSS